MEGLDELIAEWLAHEMAAHPTRATSLGIDGHDADLGEFSATAFEGRDRSNAAWAARFEALDADELSADACIDRDLVLAELRGRMVMSDWMPWRRDPSLYLNPCL